MINLGRVFGIAPELDSSTEWTRPPRIRAGEIPMEPESGIGETFLASPAPRWTSETPTHEGHWWCRAPGHPPRVAEVFRGKGRKLYMRLNGDDVFLLPQRGVHWSDRALPMPVEAR